MRRQQRPVDEVANLSALIEGEWVRGHRERSWGAVSCDAVAKLRGARALEEILKRLNLARRNFSNPYLVSSFFDYIVHLAGWWHPHFSYDPTPKQYVPQEQGRRAGMWAEIPGPTSCIKSRCGLITVPMGGSRPFPGQRSAIGP